MKNEFHGRRNRWGAFKGRALITLVLVFSMIITAPFFSNAADDKIEKFDETKGCKLTVHANNAGGEFADLENANLTVDLYKVADAVPIKGSDGYNFKLLSPFADLIIGKDMSADEWRALSQKAAAKVLSVETGKARTDVEFDKSTVNGKTEEAISLTSGPGLYLLIARSEGIENYVTAVVDQDNPKSSTIVTRAWSDTKSYVFLPELVALPTKNQTTTTDEEGNEVNNPVNTADPGPWIYETTVNLKPERDSGKLRIKKTLLRYYENGGPVTFVFDVVAKLGTGENAQIIYNDEVALVFDGTNVSAEYVTPDLPVGATVTIKEVYSGPNYSPTDASKVTQTVEITVNRDNPDEIVTVEFENDYNRRRRGGHGIINNYKYNNGWDVDQEGLEDEGTPDEQGGSEGESEEE